MSYYNVAITYTGTHMVEVEAESEGDALEKAEEEFFNLDKGNLNLDEIEVNTSESNIHDSVRFCGGDHKRCL